MQTETILAAAPAKARSSRHTVADRKRDRPEAIAARMVEAHDDTVQRLARDIEGIVARQESVKDEDLHTLGWSVPQLAEHLPDALDIVRGRSQRQLDPVN